MAYPFGQPVFQAGGGQYYPLPQPVYQNYPPAPNTDYPEEPGQFPMERQPGVFHGHELPLGCMVPALLHNNNDGIFISQKFDLLEAVTGWQVPTIHRVYEGSNDPKNRPSRQIFTCREYSDTCARQCMSAACKPFEMRVVNNLSPLQEVVFSMHREFTCTFFCHNRPEMKLYYTENNQNLYLGKVVDVWNCCNYSFQIFDANNAVRYSIKANCCQCGIHNEAPCDSCQRAEFQVWSGNEQRLESTFVKLGQGAIKNMFGVSENFSLPFPIGATWQDKALLMASILMIDFMMFEEKSQDRHDRDYE